MLAVRNEPVYYKQPHATTTTPLLPCQYACPLGCPNPGRAAAVKQNGVAGCKGKVWKEERGACQLPFASSCPGARPSAPLATGAQEVSRRTRGGVKGGLGRLITHILADQGRALRT
jgi:hypothetical protein